MERDGRGPRPDLSGPEQTLASDDGHYLLHYTTEGDDRIKGTDSDGDGVPDQLQEVLLGLAIGEEAFAERGYRPVNLDDGTGGSSAIDVYMMALDANGYATVTTSDAGQDDSCYMRLDPFNAGAVLRSVAIHEQHHCVQYAYTFHPDSWVHEATSTTEQYRLVDGLELALAFLWADRLEGAAIPIDDTQGRFEYAAFLVTHWWEHRGGDDALPALWEALADEPDWRITLDTEAERLWGMDLTTAFTEHALANAFACGRDDGQHYPDGPLACVGDFEVPYAAVDPEQTWTVRFDAASHTAAHARIDAPEGQTGELACEVAAGEGGLALAAVDAAGVAVEERVGTLDQVLTLTTDPGPGGGFVAVVTGTGDVPLDASCVLTPVAPEAVPSGCGCSATEAWGGAMGLLPLLGILPRRRRRRGRPASP